MKVLMVLGSPRRKGNSETLCLETIAGLQEDIQCDVESLYLHKLKISPCMSCGGCEKSGNCVIKDDLTELFEKVDEADIIFLVSPVYFYGPSAQIKTFIDRFQSRWSRKYLLNQRVRTDDKRKGYLIATAATQGKKVFDACQLIAKSFFDTIDVPYGGECYARNVDERGAINKNIEELKKARKLGQEIAKELLQ